MPTTITSAGITFNDATTLTSALVPTTSLTGTIAGTQIADGSVTAAKLGTTEQKQIAKAWVNFDGTTSPGTIRSSYNVSSITKNGTGDYTVNFTTPMADGNYSVNISNGLTSVGTNRGNYLQVLATNGTQIRYYENGVLADSSLMCATVFGN